MQYICKKKLDLKALKKLEYIDYSGGPLEELDISNNPNLKRVEVHNTNVKAFDVSNNPKLKIIIVDEGTEIIGETNAEIEYWTNDDLEKDEVLFEKNNKEMLTKGRLNEKFVKRFSNLTTAKMTAAELKVYREYVGFLILEAGFEDMNMVIKNSYKRTKNGEMKPKESAYELADAMDIAMREYSMKSSEIVDTLILEKCTIMRTALTRTDTHNTGKISLKGVNYTYEYIKDGRFIFNFAPAMLSIESYTTAYVSTDPVSSSDNLNKAKTEYLKNLMRKSLLDYVVGICKLTVDTGADILFHELPAGQQIRNGLGDLYIGRMSSSYKKEDFGIKSEGTSTMADLLKVRVSIAHPGTKEGELVYYIYPTDETREKIELYNTVFKYYKMKPMRIEDVYNDPEAVNEMFAKLEDKIEAKAYKYGDKEFGNLDDIDDEYYRNKREKN